jgi:hypothetical protein
LRITHTFSFENCDCFSKTVEEKLLEVLALWGYTDPERIDRPAIIQVTKRLLS